MKRIFIDLKNLKTIKQLPVMVKERAAQEVVLLNVSSRTYTLDELLSLNTYHYFWKKDKIRVVVGKHNHLGQPVIAHRLNNNVFRYLFNRDVKPINVSVQVAEDDYIVKKMYDLRAYKRMVKPVLIAISSWYEFKLYTQTKDVIGQDGHVARDAMGFELSYTTSEYNQINVLVDKRVKYKTLKPFMKKMVFWKTIGKQQKLVPVRLDSIIKYFNEQYKDYINLEYSEVIQYINESPDFNNESKVSDYLRMFGTAKSCQYDMETKISMLNYIRTGYEKNLCTEIGPESLLEIADTYNDKRLKTYVKEQISQGNMPEEGVYLAGLDTIISALAHGFATPSSIDGVDNDSFNDESIGSDSYDYQERNVEVKDYSDYNELISKYAGEVKTYTVSKDDLALMKIKASAPVQEKPKTKMFASSDEKLIDFPHINGKIYKVVVRDSRVFNAYTGQEYFKRDKK